MGRPIKWSGNLHAIQERAVRSRIETWSRQDVEHLFAVGRATAQSLMKAIGEIEAIGGAHFVGRGALLGFLDQMIAAPSVEDALRARLLEAEPPPRPRALRVSLPADLRHAMLPDLPANVTLEPGRLEIRAGSAESLLESLVTLAMVMQNDLDRFAVAFAPAPNAAVRDRELREMFQRLRADHLPHEQTE